MPRPIPPPPAFTPADEAIITPIAEMDARDLFANSNAPEVWTLDVLRRRQNGTLSRHAALRLQRYVLDVLRLDTTAKRWAILAATDTLGAVDTTRLTRVCLAGLLQHSEALYQNIVAQTIRDVPTLRARLAARQLQLLSACPLEGPAYRLYLDRVADALTPLLR